MNIRVLFILLVLSILLAFIPRYRRPSLIISVVLLLLLAWVGSRMPTTKEIDVAESTSNVSSISARPAAQFQSITLEGNGAPWRLAGTVQNISTVMMRSLSVNIERFDCPSAETPLSNCTLQWQGVHVLRSDVQPTAIVKVDDSFYSHDPVPRITGIARDRFTITDVE